MSKNSFSCNEIVKDLSNFSSGIDYDSLSALSSGTAMNGYNFCYENGALSDGYGVSDLCVKNGLGADRIVSTGEIVPSIFLCFTESVNGETFLVVVGNNNNVYVNNTSDIDNSFNQIFEFDDMPNVVKYYYNNVNYLLFSSNYLFSIYDGTNANRITIDNAKKIFDICQHDNTLFLVLDDGYKNKIFYSDDLNPLNIQSGLAEMDCINIPDIAGNVVKLISFDNYLYVFCEYGVYRYVSYEVKKKNCLELIYSGSNKIYKNTVVATGSKIIFFSTDGIYVCNGLKCEKLDLKIDKLIRDVINNDAKAIIYNGKYFLSCNLNFDDDEIVGCEVIPRKNTSLVVVDFVESKASVCRGVGLIDIDNLMSDYDNKIMCVSGYTTIVVGEIDKCGFYAPDIASLKKWKTPFIDLDKPTKLKVCKYISLKTTNDIELKVMSDETDRIINIVGSDKIQTIKVDVKGRIFGVEISCEKSDIQISDLKMVVDIYD